MRHLIRRFWICERGAGLVEYGLLLGVLSLALIGVLGLYRTAVGGVTERTAATVGRQAGRGYGTLDAPVRHASANPRESGDSAPDPGAPPDSAGNPAAAVSARAAGSPFRLFGP